MNSVQGNEFKFCFEFFPESSTAYINLFHCVFDGYIWILIHFKDEFLERETFNRGKASSSINPRLRVNYLTTLQIPTGSQVWTWKTSECFQLFFFPVSSSSLSPPHLNI